MIDKNIIWEVKYSIEKCYGKFHDSHQKLLDLLEDSSYVVTEENSKKIESILKKYNIELEKIEDSFSPLEKHDDDIKEILRDDVGMLKKQRMETLTRISSQMEKRYYDDDLPF